MSEIKIEFQPGIVEINNSYIPESWVAGFGPEAFALSSKGETLHFEGFLSPYQSEEVMYERLMSFRNGHDVKIYLDNQAISAARLPVLGGIRPNAEVYNPALRFPDLELSGIWRVVPHDELPDIVAKNLLSKV